MTVKTQTRNDSLDAMTVTRRGFVKMLSAGSRKTKSS